MRIKRFNLTWRDKPASQVNQMLGAQTPGLKIGENMKKIVLCYAIFVCSISGVFAQSVNLVLVKGQEFTTGGDYYDGQYISYASVPEEKRYIKGFYISLSIPMKPARDSGRNLPPVWY